MNAKDWERVRAVYDAARDLDPIQGERLAREQLGDRADLVEEVLGMLGFSPPPGFIEPLGTVEELERLFGGKLEGETLGEFELVRQVGRGGMGAVVYQARQKYLERPVAIKVLPHSRASDERTLVRFRREANSISQLEHPNIVQVFAFGELEDLAWYAMRFVDGHDLATEIREQRKARWGRPEARPLLPKFDSDDYVGTVVHRLAELAEAIQHAHDRGVVHRDVKPHNILLDREGRMHLADFGLAKDERFGTLTAIGEIGGTVHYMSPEQARARAATVDHRTDLYSLSVVLYELLALSRPFEGRTSQEVISRIEKTEPKPLRKRNTKVPRDLAVICAKGMSKFASDRYGTAQELAADLRAFLRHESILAKPPSVTQLCLRWIRRNRIESLAASAVVLAIALTYWYANHRASVRESRATLTEISQALLVDDWMDEPEFIASVCRLLEEGAGRRGSTNLELAQATRSFQERLQDFRVEGLELAAAKRLRGLGGPLDVSSPGEPPELPSSPDLFESIRILQGLRIVFPEDAEIQNAASVQWLYPRIDLSVEVVDEQGQSRPSLPGELELAYAVIEPHLDSVSEYQPLEPSPEGELLLPPGYYSLRVRVPGYGHADLVRQLVSRSEPYRLLARVHSEQEVQRDMAPIDGGSLTLVAQEYRDAGCLEFGSTLQIDSFHLDRAEVSNGEYLVYLEASGRSAPPQWIDIGFDGTPESMAPPGQVSTWLELPVVFLSWGTPWHTPSGTGSDCLGTRSRNTSSRGSWLQTWRPSSFRAEDWLMSGALSAFHRWRLPRPTMRSTWRRRFPSGARPICRAPSASTTSWAT